MKKLIKLLEKNNIAFTTKGNSMFPLFANNDKVILKKYNFHKIKLNDFVLIKKHSLIIHRVIYRGKKFLITKGDNNLKSDGKIYNKDYIALVYKIERKGHVFQPKLYYLSYSMIYYKELSIFIHKLNKFNINYVILKGLPLYLYYNKTEPQFLYTDCDFLIARNEYSKVKSILEDLGFSPETKGLFITSFFNNEATQVTFFKLIDKITVRVDIHLSLSFLLSQSDHIDPLYSYKEIQKLTSEFLKQKIRVYYQDINFFILKREFLIIYLALHSFHHNYRNIRRLELLNVIIRKTNLNKENYKYLYSFLNQYKLINFVYPVFIFLNKYYSNIHYRKIIKILKSEVSSSIKIEQVNIFDEEKRLSAGINRFILIYKLSARNKLIKPLVFLNPTILSLVISILLKILRKYLNLNFIHKNKV